MNPLDRQLFFRGFREQLAASMPYEKAEKIWSEAGEEYARILSADPSCATKKDIARKNPETSIVSGFFYVHFSSGLLSFSRKCPIRDCVARTVFHVRLLHWGLLRKNRPPCHQLYCSAIMVMSSNCGSCPTKVSICCLI